ncbi:MAG: hypothetical protein FJ026_17090, partial [Chloroflexi bacterium]|nr:hypothetical protein [Chloroflexota bacterium]
GGDHDDEGFGVDLDGSRNVYVVGSTYSTQATFPVSVGPDVSHNGSSDAFVAKVKADGTELLYCGYIGGSGYDSGLNVAVDGSGNAYVCGHTLSDESAFPLMTGPGLTYGGGSQRGDGFVAKVRADGTGLTYCGYIGGDQDDSVEGVAIDSLGSAFVTGWTSSSEATFPITNTTWPSSTVYNGGASDAFVAKVHPSGAVLSYCGYLGGSGEEQAHDIALDALGHAYVTGFTGSDERTFPVVVGPDLTHNGGYDCFVAKVDPIASGLVFCGYFGGTGNDEGWAIVADQLENTYVTGQTSSTEGSFPVFRGPDLVYNGGLHDAFVAKVSAYLDCSMSVSAPPGGVCAGSSGHTASVPDSGPGALFGWSIENGIITSVPTYTETISWTAGAVGMVGIGITITDTQGYTCSATVAVVAYENPDCTITTDAPEVCAGSAGHTAWVPSAGGGASYDWALSGGSITAGQNSNVITWTAGAPGTITITLALTDPWGCGCTNSVTVTGKAAPAAGFSAYPQSCCAPLTVQFTDTSTSENGGLAGGGGSLATGVLPQGRIPATCTQAVASTPCPYGSLIPWVVAAS